MDKSLFDSIKHIDGSGREYWFARELMPVLQYSQWRNFAHIIDKAKIACEGSNNKVSDHFAEVSKMVNAGVSTKPIDDYRLSRYACYLVAMNGDTKKKPVALAQTYFAAKTRQQEIAESYGQLSEDRRRLFLRDETRQHNKTLADAAKNAGVTQSRDYAIFQNAGYKGLYNGLGQQEIHERKGLKKSQKILDHMGSTELAANLFRITQTEERLKQDNIQGKENATKTHFTVGRKVRKAIADIGGTMPENLPTPDKSIQQLERDTRRQLDGQSDKQGQLPFDD